MRLLLGVGLGFLTGQSGERFGRVEAAEVRKKVQPQRHEAHEGIHEEERKMSGLSGI
jgi:hypothetical protein